jgi:hypothetical protein
MTDQQNPHYVTPEEAKKKICLLSMGGLLMVHDAVMVSEHECHGPDCMAWRWRPKGHQDLMQGAMLQLPLVPEESMTHGYCGLVRS